MKTVGKRGLSIVEKPTVNDIARVAGVSLATVDRVLNERPGVRLVTIEKVQKAINELGYVRDTAAANLARRRMYNLLFILPGTKNEFVEALENQIAVQATRLINERTRLTVSKAPPFDAQAIVNMLDELDPDTTDGVAVFGPETPSVRDAIKRACDRDIAVVALVSDLPSSERHHFVGIDNIAAGRSAAKLMGRFTRRPGKVLVITGSRLSRDHLERRTGFDEVLQQEFPDLVSLPSIEARDDSELLYRLLPDVFGSRHDIVGIYSSAGGNLGLVRYLEEMMPGNDLVVIAHELTPLTRAALEADTFDALICQDTGHIVRSAVRLLRATADKVPFNATQEHIRIDIYIKENLLPEQAETEEDT